MLRLLGVGALLCSCSNLVVLRGSSNDFLKRKATSVVVNAPAPQVQATLDELFYQRGFRPQATTNGDKGSQVVIYKGSRPVPPEAANYGVQLGSWFAARIANTEPPGSVEVMVMGKPSIGIVELCSDHDKLFEDIKYTCNDTKVPPDWAGKNLVSGRDETEVVSWVLTGLYERLKH